MLVIQSRACFLEALSNIVKQSTESASFSKIERIHRNRLIFDKIFKGKALKEIALDFSILGFSFDQDVSFWIGILQGQTQPWCQRKHSCDHIRARSSTPTHLCRPCNMARLLLQTDSWGGGGMVSIELQLGRRTWPASTQPSCSRSPRAKRQHPKAHCQSLPQDRACAEDLQVWWEGSGNLGWKLDWSSFNSSSKSSLLFPQWEKARCGGINVTQQVNDRDGDWACGHADLSSCSSAPRLSVYERDLYSCSMFSFYCHAYLICI